MTKNKKKLFSVISLNVKGLSDSSKRHSTFTSLRSHPSDIILLQETNISPLQITFVQSQWFLPSFWNHYTAILINNKNIIIEKIQEHHGGHHQVLEFSLNGNTYKVNNIYAPPQRPERLVFWSKVSISSNIECINLVEGNFNCVLNPNRDRKSSAPYHIDKSASQIHQKLTDFIDCYPQLQQLLSLLFL